MKIVSWNVNSIRARYDRVLNWLEAHQPDVVCLQELKCQESEFPFDELSSIGYFAAVNGQKTYNGVALLSLEPFEDIVCNMDDGIDDPQARLIAGTVRGVRVVDVYVPNGEKLTSAKWPYKLAWYDRLAQWLQTHADPAAPLVLCGDFNIAPTDLDAARPDKWHNTVLAAPPGRAALQRLVDWGLIDTFRQHHPDAAEYSWWDYRPPGLRANDGLRIDQIYATAPLAARCTAAGIDKEERMGTKPSDHAPIWAEFDI